MSNYDPEIEELRTRVHCGVVLERTPPPWRLDRKESTKKSLKYRRDKGEILIVSHEGRGWWDPMSDASGDVFGLVQRLEPDLNFGHVRKRLRALAGVAPTFPTFDRAGEPRSPARSIAERWTTRPPVRENSPTWRYLVRERRLARSVVAAAAVADVLREGPCGSAWFAHRDGQGAVAHVDIRGPLYQGSLMGGVKSFFCLPATDSESMRPRLVLAEAAIDALSVASLEAMRADTLYAATGGGMGPSTISALETLLAAMSSLHGAALWSAADANDAGDRFAEQHAALAEAFGVAFVRLRPPKEGSDWNDVRRVGVIDGDGCCNREDV
jgi:Toprim-like/Protein of unknown function (DUF3991)